MQETSIPIRSSLRTKTTSKIALNNDELLSSERAVIDAINGVLASGRFEVSEYIDLGCGNGALTYWISEIIQSKKTYGIDYLESNCRDAQENGISALTLDLDRQKLPFLDSTFDFASMIEVIEHVSNKDQILKETHRILKVGGLFLVSTRNIASIINRMLLLIGQVPWSYDLSAEYWIDKRIFQKEKAFYGHFTTQYNLNSICNHLEKIGFSIIEIKGMTGPQFNMFGPLKHTIGKIVMKMPTFAPGFVILARKNSKKLHI